jgi:hypothetical protein
MTVTRADIAEYDVVVLLKDVDGWAAGTRGHVVMVCPADMWVEVADGQGGEADLVWAPREDLGLVEKWPPGGPGGSADQF